VNSTFVLKWFSFLRLNEDLTEAIITVNRTSGSTGTASVDFRTSNGTGFVPCNQFNGVAAQNCDFALPTGTLSFGNGETSKTFTVDIVNAKDKAISRLTHAQFIQKKIQRDSVPPDVTVLHVCYVDWY
jgi:hypothetical protein